MNKVHDFTVEDFLREQLLEFSLATKNKILFERMTGADWRKYVIQDADSTKETNDDKLIPYYPEFLEDEFFQDADSISLDMDSYIENTTITADYGLKKKRLLQLFVLSRSSNQELCEFISKLLEDDDLIRLLTLITDKTYRNGVFYIDEEQDAIRVKDNREKLRFLSNIEVLDFYKENNVKFFLEIEIFDKEKT